MSQEIFITFDNMGAGLYALKDTTKAPWSSARLMKNMMITDRQGVGPRPGTNILGASNSSALFCKGFYNFKKSFESDEILLKVYDTFLEGYSKNYSTAGWFRIKSNLTSDKDTGFISALLNTDNNDYCIIGNRYDSQMAWDGALAQLTVALLGGETTATVDSTLTGEIYNTQISTSSSTTTLTVSSAPWATDQWTKLFVHILTGPQAGKISPISATTTDTITFTSMGGDPGTGCHFEIRKTKFPASGSVVIGGSTVAYSAIASDTTLTISPAPIAALGSMVNDVPVVYINNPQGNRFCNYLGRMITVHVRSAIALGSGSTAQGYVAGGNFYVSKITDPFDYTYSAPRIAGEGDFQPTPYGGGDILDAATFEDTFYIFKRDYIEADSYSQDSSDTIIRTPLKTQVGSIGKVIVGSDDIYFMTPDKRFTSIGRAKLRDLKPHTDNIGITIKRILDTYDFSDVAGIQYKNRILIACKSSSDILKNDIIIIYNWESGAFEGIWDIPAMGFSIWQNDRLFYAESNSANVYEMFVGNADVNAQDRFAIASQYASQFFDVTPIRRNYLKNRVGELQQCHGFYFEGYIKGNSTITFEAWKDFAVNPFLQFDFSGSETGFEDPTIDNAFLGGAPIGLNPEGSVGPVQEDGRRHFVFRVFFPYQYGNYFSIGFKSSGVDIDYEVTRIGLGMAPSANLDTKSIKSVSN